MVKRLSTILLFITFATSIFAQNENDALRFSFLTYGGTARYMGMSGAFSALGADFSVLSTNPAGIGSFKKSRVMFSAGAIMMNTGTDYWGENTQDDYVKSNINNLGLILNLKPYTPDETGWKTVAFGVGYNYLQNLSNNITIEGTNPNSSFLDIFMINSDGTPPEELSDWLWMAYDTYATDTIPNSDYTYINPLYDFYGEKQRRVIKSQGGIGEWVFSLGGNYNDFIQIGATFGIQNIRSKYTLTHSESTESGDFKNFDYTETVETKGVGSNFKLGMIIRPVHFLRVGLAFHTPTFYSMTDIYSYQMDTYWRTPDSDGNTEYHSSAGEYEYSYEYYSPFRTVAGLAFVLWKYAIVSADYEYVDYGKSRFRADDYDFETENNSIKEKFGNGHNLRAGLEIRLAPVYLRGGVSYYSSATSERFKATGSVSGYSLGIGLKTRSVYIDFAFNHSYSKNNYLLYEYDQGLSENANYNISKDQINFTLGYKF